MSLTKSINQRSLTRWSAAEGMLSRRSLRRALRRSANPVFAVKSMHSFGVDVAAFAPQQRRQAPIAEARLFGGQPAQGLPQGWLVVARPRPITLGRVRQSDQPAGFAFAEVMVFDDVVHRFTPSRGL